MAFSKALMVNWFDVGETNGRGNNAFRIEPRD